MNQSLLSLEDSVTHGQHNPGFMLQCFRNEAGMGWYGTRWYGTVRDGMVRDMFYSFITNATNYWDFLGDAEQNFQKGDK